MGLKPFKLMLYNTLEIEFTVHPETLAASALQFCDISAIKYFIQISYVSVPFHFWAKTAKS